MAQCFIVLYSSAINSENLGIFPSLLGNVSFHLSIFFTVYLAPCISLVKNVDCSLPRLLVVFLVRATAVAPVSDVRKH